MGLGCYPPGKSQEEGMARGEGWSRPEVTTEHPGRTGTRLKQKENNTYNQTLSFMIIIDRFNTTHFDYNYYTKMKLQNIDDSKAKYNKTFHNPPQY